MRQVLLALITIIAVASLGAVGTYASFSDIETSRGNYLEMGSLDLQLGDTKPYPGGSFPYEPDEDYGDDPDSVTLTWDYELGYSLQGMMIPGDTLASMVKLQNVGSIVGSSLDISCSNQNSAPGSGPLDKDTQMIIDALLYHNMGNTLNLLANPDPDKCITDQDGDGKITLNDWELDPIVGLTPPPLGAQAYLEMTVLFDPTAPFVLPPGDPDSYQGCWTNMTLLFALMQ